MLRAINITVKKIGKISILIYKTITDICEYYEKVKTRWENSEMLGGSNLKKGFSEKFKLRFKEESKLIMEELEIDDSRHREEQVLRAKGVKGIL